MDVSVGSSDRGGSSGSSLSLRSNLSSGKVGRDLGGQ